VFADWAMAPPEMVARLSRAQVAIERMLIFLFFKNRVTDHRLDRIYSALCAAQTRKGAPNNSTDGDPWACLRCIHSWALRRT